MLHCLMRVRQFLVASILKKGLYQAQAITAFLQSSKQAYAQHNPSANLDNIEADQIIQDIRADLGL